MDSKLFDSSWPMTIGNVEYSASIFTDRDYGDLDNWIRATYISNSFKSAEQLEKSDDSEDISKGFEIRKFTLGEAPNVGWRTFEGINIMGTKEGILRIGWQMIRKRHPQVQFKDFKLEAEKDIIKSMTDINLVDKQLNYVKKDSSPGGADAENDKSE